MPAYIVLYQFTEQGIKNIKSFRQKVDQAHEAIENLGGKVIGCYGVMGEYDSVGIYEFPSDQVAMAFLLGMGATGEVKTTTLKAFPYEEFGEIASNLP